MSGPRRWRPLDDPDPPPKTLRAGIDGVVRHLGGPDTDVMTQLFGRWRELVGDVLAAHVRPVRLTGGDLVLEVDDGAWATEVRYFDAELRRRIAEVVGDGVVDAIRVRVRR